MKPDSSDDTQANQDSSARRRTGGRLDEDCGQPGASPDADPYAAAFRAVRESIDFGALGSGGEADDALSESVFRVVRRNRNNGGVRDLKGYMFVAAKHAVAEHRRKRARERRVLVRSLEEADRQVPAFEPCVRAVELEELRERLLRAINILPRGLLDALGDDPVKTLCHVRSGTREDGRTYQARSRAKKRIAELLRTSEREEPPIAARSSRPASMTAQSGRWIG